MQILHLLKINVLKVVVMLGTFSLAMAFSGNDLVNFIGVPLTGLASYQISLSWLTVGRRRNHIGWVRSTAGRHSDIFF